MNDTLHFTVTGKDRAELEHKAKEMLISYFGLDTSQKIDDRVDWLMDVRPVTFSRSGGILTWQGDVMATER